MCRRLECCGLGLRTCEKSNRFSTWAICLLGGSQAHGFASRFAAPLQFKVDRAIFSLFLRTCEKSSRFSTSAICLLRGSQAHGFASRFAAPLQLQVDRRIFSLIPIAALIVLLSPRVAVAADTVLPDAITSTVLPTDAELEDSWARVILRANPGPYQYLAYEVTYRDHVGVVSHLRGFMGRSDVVSRTDLLRQGDMRRLMGWLRDHAMLQMPKPLLPVATKPRQKNGKVAKPTDDEGRIGPASSPVPIFELSFRLGGQENTVLVAEPFAQADRRYALFIETLRQVATSAAGHIAYQPPSGSMGAQGFLFIDSMPSAEVAIDGVPIGESTPVLSWAVAPGSHTITLENKRLGLKVSTKAKVQAGLTTSVELPLQ